MKKFTGILFILLLSTWFAYSQQHTFTSFTPNCVCTGETVTLKGTNFTGVTGVTFGGTPAQSFIVVNNTTITAVVGAGTTGSIEITKPSYTAASLTGFTFFPFPTITAISTDFANYWATNTTTPSAIFPNDSHNLLSFTYGGTTYSTGVNDAMLSNQNVVFTPGKFKALPSLINGNVPIPLPSSLFIVAASLIDGNLQQGLVSHPNISALNFENVLSDGINGLNLGTGYTNLPSTAVMNFSVFSIDSSKINDNEPDIILTQIADPTLTNSDTYTFKDINGNTVGNSEQVSMQQVARLGSYRLDLFSVSGGQPWGATFPSSITNNTPTYNNTTRDIRFVAFRLSDFGINASNYQQIKRFEVIPSGVTDVAFVAYNANAINIPPAVSTNTSSSSVICTTGGSAFLKVNAIDAAGGALSYAWQVSTNNGSSWSAVTDGGIYTGASTSALNISAATTGYQYRCVVSEVGVVPQGISPVFTITATASSPLSGTLNPAASASNCLNSNTLTKLAVSPTGGTGSYMYQWQSSTTSGSGFVDMPGEVASTLTVPLNAVGTKYYRVVIKSGCLSNTSTQSAVTINGASITSASPGIICSPGSVSLGATASTGTINWYATASSATSLGTGTTYNTPSLTADSTFYVGVTSGACSSVRTPVKASIASTINLNNNNFVLTNVSDVVIPGTATVSFYSPALPNGTHTVYYRLLGANAQSSSVNVSVLGEQGSFATGALNAIGANTIIIDSISILSSTGCARPLNTNNSFIFTTSSATPLPVNLLYFEAQAGIGSTVVTRWATAQEAHSAWFILERQSGTGNWIEVGRLAAAGNTADMQRYEMADEQALPGVNYYRLRMVDIDQHTSYSPVRMVLFQQEDEAILLYPNPVNTTLTIQSAQAMNDVPYQLTDIRGRVLLQGRLNDRVNVVSLESLSKGMYLIRIGEGNVQSFRIIRN